MRVIAIVQARTGSTRLPGKVLMDLAGEPMLVRVIERTRRSLRVTAVVVATSAERRDDAIAELSRQRSWTCFRGSENDVLDRYYRAAREHGADLVVRITSDCPLTDPELVDAHIDRLLNRWNAVDFVTNMMRESYPLGLAVEAMPFDVLERMHRMTVKPEWREHVTTLAYTRPELFVADQVIHDEDLSKIRWTVDTPEDLQLVREIYGHFGNDRFSWQEALTYYRQRPELADLNRDVRQKSV
jgi:spore coat polysaccharide biosynthesis protein SpsF